ncbi:hypothetical protein HK102_003090, partial [Quaeritorhiza haematococci]
PDHCVVSDNVYPINPQSQGPIRFRFTYHVPRRIEPLLATIEKGVPPRRNLNGVPLATLECPSPAAVGNAKFFAAMVPEGLVAEGGVVFEDDVARDVEVGFADPTGEIGTVSAPVKAERGTKPCKAVAAGATVNVGGRAANDAGEFSAYFDV